MQKTPLSNILVLRTRSAHYNHMTIPLDPNIAFGILIASTAILILWIIYLEIRLRKLTRGGDGKSLENIIHNTASRAREYEEHLGKAFDYLKHLDARLKHGMRGLSVVRFNAFGESGGQQSFATALINEHGDGIILSNLQARGHMALYVKPVKKFVSEIELTPEERQALIEAKEKVED